MRGSCALSLKHTAHALTRWAGLASRFAIMQGMESSCFGCGSSNPAGQAYSGTCGSPLAIRDYVAQRVDIRLREVTKERDLVERETAMNVFEKAYRWMKLVAGAWIGAGALVLACSAFYGHDLKQTATRYMQEIVTSGESAKSMVEQNAKAATSQIKPALPGGGEVRQLRPAPG